MSPAATARLARWVRHGFYPLALALTLAYVVAEGAGVFGPLGRAYPLYLLWMVGTLLWLERAVPLRPEWRMTRPLLLKRDLPMLAINGLTIALVTRAITGLGAWAALSATGIGVWMRAALPLWLQTLIALALADFVWYWVHRYSHEGRGAFGRWLWRTHVLHHLPAQVYVLMHAVGHPINLAYVRVVLLLPAIWLGLSPEAAFAAGVLNGFQGLVSHFNVEIRAGVLNHLLIGTELHRYHHSVAAAEAGNYGAVFSLFDRCFGTYRLPGPAPACLGVADRTRYPADDDWPGLLALPWRRKYAE